MSKEKALQFIEDNTEMYQKTYWSTIRPEKAKEAIEIALKSEWYYPSKNELPKTGEMVYLALSNGSYKQQLFDEHDNNTVDYFKDENYVKAWTYLPSL